MSNLKHEVIAERWAVLIKERIDSGMTIKEWCRERNIKESQYYYWLKAFREEEADEMGQERQSSPFVELPVVFPEQKLQKERAVAIIRKGDIFIEITESSIAGFIAKIMEAVAYT